MLHAERALYALKIFLPFSPSALSLSTGRIWASPLRAKRRKPIEPDTDGSSSTSSSDNTMHFVRWPGRRPGFKICPNHDGGCPVVRQLSGSSGCFYYILCVDFLPLSIRSARECGKLLFSFSSFAWLVCWSGSLDGFPLRCGNVSKAKQLVR